MHPRLCGHGERDLVAELRAGDARNLGVGRYPARESSRDHASNGVSNDGRIVAFTLEVPAQDAFERRVPGVLRGGALDDDRQEPRGGALDGLVDREIPRLVT